MSDKLISLAASLVRGECLYRLLDIAEKQKTVSSSVLERELEIVADELKLAAITIRKEIKR